MPWEINFNFLTMGIIHGSWTNYSGCFSGHCIWALVRGGVRRPCTGIGWKNEGSQVPTSLFKTLRISFNNTPPTPFHGDEPHLNSHTTIFSRISTSKKVQYFYTKMKPLYVQSIPSFLLCIYIYIYKSTWNPYKIPATTGLLYTCIPFS